MRTIVIVTGTPGVGKSRLAREISRKDGYSFVDLGQLVRKEHLYSRFDRTRGSYILDEAKIRRRLETISKPPKKTVIAYHTVGRFLPRNLVKCALVLRLDPSILYRRLRARGWTRQKAWENTEAEIIDISLQESLNFLGRRRVNEIDTTGKSVLQVYKEARIALSEPGMGRIGKVNWLARFDPVEWGRKK